MVSTKEEEEEEETKISQQQQQQQQRAVLSFSSLTLHDTSNQHLQTMQVTE